MWTILWNHPNFKTWPTIGVATWRTWIVMWIATQWHLNPRLAEFLCDLSSKKDLDYGTWLATIHYRSWGKFVWIAHHKWKWGVMGEKLVPNKWHISKCVFSQWHWKYELKHCACLLIMVCLFIVKIGLKNKSWMFGWDFLWRYMKLTVPYHGIVHFEICIFL